MYGECEPSDNSQKVASARLLKITTQYETHMLDIPNLLRKSRKYFMVDQVMTVMLLKIKYIY